jgi:hypothetical protein
MGTRIDVSGQSTGSSTGATRPYVCSHGPGRMPRERLPQQLPQRAQHRGGDLAAGGDCGADCGAHADQPEARAPSLPPGRQAAHRPTIRVPPTSRPTVCRSTQRPWAGSGRRPPSGPIPPPCTVGRQERQERLERHAGAAAPWSLPCEGLCWRLVALPAVLGLVRSPAFPFYLLELI